ncbi:MAG: YbaN family protein [Dehalococcoidales bacterium]
MTPTPDKLKRRLFVIAGTIALVIGVIGIIIPVLPTTPFLLLAAICYMRGSQRLYNALLCNRFMGSYVRNYLEGRGMSLKMRIWTISLLWVAIVCTAALATDSLIIRIILAVVLIGVTIHIFLIKTVKNNTKPTNNLRP